MKMKTTYSKKVAGMVSGLVLVLPLSARAEIKAGSFEVSPFGGYTVIENSQNLKNQCIYGRRVCYNITKEFGTDGGGGVVNHRVE